MQMCVCIFLICVCVRVCPRLLPRFNTPCMQRLTTLPSNHILLSGRRRQQQQVVQPIGVLRSGKKEKKGRERREAERIRFSKPSALSKWCCGLCDRCPAVSSNGATLAAQQQKQGVSCFSAFKKRKITSSLFPEKLTFPSSVPDCLYCAAPARLTQVATCGAARAQLKSRRAVT